MEDLVHLQHLDTFSGLVIEAMARFTSCTQEGIRHTESYTWNRLEMELMMEDVPCRHIKKMKNTPESQQNNEMYCIDNDFSCVHK